MLQSGQCGGGGGCPVPKRRQRHFGARPRVCCSTCKALRLGRNARVLRQGGLCRDPGSFRLFPAQVEEKALCLPQPFAHFAVTLRLPGLAGKCRQLCGELLDHVIDTCEIRFCTGELQFGLVPTLVEARNSCRLLENASACLGLGIDQFRDLALTHKRR